MVIAPARLVEWPLRCGPVPPLADCHSTRPETGLGRIGKLDPADTLILVMLYNGDDPSKVTDQTFNRAISTIEKAVAVARSHPVTPPKVHSGEQSWSVHMTSPTASVTTLWFDPGNVGVLKDH